MKHRILVPCLLACLVASSSRIAVAQDDHMAVFKPLVGEWKTVSVAQPSERNSEKSTGPGELSVKMILGDKFLRYEGVGTSPRLGRLEYQALMNYDERRQTYRRWVFRSDAVTAESTGAWDADKKTMTWTSVGVPENVTITATTTITDDGFQETLYGKRADGTVLTDLTMTATKKP
jgi:hypothetical protein